MLYKWNKSFLLDNHSIFIWVLSFNWSVSSASRSLVSQLGKKELEGKRKIGLQSRAFGNWLETVSVDTQLECSTREY